MSSSKGTRGPTREKDGIEKNEVNLALMSAAARRTPAGSPADAYIRYRIVSEPHASVDELVESLRDERIHVDGEHLQRVAERTRPPAGFRPRDLLDRPSQQFLRSAGIWTMWHRHPGTVEAMALLEDPRSRMAVQTLITGGVEDDRIVKVAADHLKAPLSVFGLAEFRHYFWDPRLLTRPELAEYVSRHLRDAELARIAMLPPCEATRLRAMAVVGASPPVLDERRIVDDWMAMVSRLCNACATDLPVGPAQAAALRHHVESFATLREVRAELHRDDHGFEDSPYDPQTADIPMPTLADLAAGRAVPFPVGSLLPPEDREAVPTDGDVRAATG